MRFYKLIILILVIFSLKASANNKADSLLTIYFSNNASNELKTDAIFKLTKYVNSKIADTCLVIANNALNDNKWGKRSNYVFLLLKGVSIKQQWKLDEGVGLLQEHVKSIPKKHVDLLIHYNYHIARGMLGASNYEESIKYFFKSIDLNEKHNVLDPYIMASSVYYLSFNFRGQGDFGNAIKWNKKALELAENLNDTSLLVGVILSQANIYREKNDPEYDKSEDLYRRILKMKGDANMVSVYSNMGQLFEVQEMPDSAQLYYTLALNEAEKEGSILWIVFTNLNSGLNEIRLNNYSYGIKLCKKAYDLADKSGIQVRKKDACQCLSLGYSKLKDFESAYTYYKTYSEMKDSLVNEKHYQESIQQQTQYEFEKDKIKKENEAKETARIEAEATGRRNNLQYSLIFLGILLLFGIVLSLGFIKVSPNIAEGLIFFAFLILFEFILVFTDPYLQDITHDEPMYNLAANAIIALLIFPMHAILEKLLKKRIVKN